MKTQNRDQRSADSNSILAAVGPAVSCLVSSFMKPAHIPQDRSCPWGE